MRESESLHTYIRTTVQIQIEKVAVTVFQSEHFFFSVDILLSTH